MRKKIVTAAVFSLMSSVAFAQDGVICESDPHGTSAKMEFRFHSPGVSEAQVLEYQGRNVMDDPLSIFNHMGIIRFRGSNGIEFVANDFSNEFYVTVPGFGGERLTTAEGMCRAKE